MVYLLFLLLSLPLSLAVPQGTSGIRSSTSISTETRAVLVSTRSATTAKGATTTTKGAITTTKATATTKGVTTTSPPKPTTTRKGAPAPVVVNCSDPSWQPTVGAWVKEGVDRKLKKWWESVPNRASKNFVTELGRTFGDFEHSLACGVDTEDQCVNPSCKAFLDAKAPKWTYFVRVAISNLNRFMRLLHDGIGDGQMDFESLREDVAQNFIPWEDSSTKLQKAAPWIAAAFSTVAGFVPLLPVRGMTGSLIAGVSAAGAAFGGAALTEISGDPTMNTIVGRVVELSEMGKFVADYCSTSRDILGKWSTVIFNGGKDKSGRDIFDYLRGGRFVLHDKWTRSDLENFFKKRLVAWFVNSEIREHTKTFILCANSTNPGSVISPSGARYITSNGTRVCSLYRLDDNGKLGDLVAVERLKQPQYNITASDMVQSSVEAYIAHGLNYTAEDMMARLQVSARLPSDQQWFSKGAAGEGAFTIPVCDVGENTEWLSKGMPCCCGLGCDDTKNFMESANMGSFDPVEKECKQICPECNVVNYGSDTSSLSRPSWRVLAGVFFAIVGTNFLLD